MAQSEWVRGRILERHPDVRVELIPIKTKGDRIMDSPLSKIGGKGLFVKEIEEALLSGTVDLAVHSIKDVPAELPEGLNISLFPEREDPRDAFISPGFKGIQELPKGASVGTGSLRRSAQLLSMRPDLKVVPIRGNVDTRLKKAESGEIDAVILAVAGLKRLGLRDRIDSIMPLEEMLPAVGQGALGLEIRRDDQETLELIGFLNHGVTEVTVRAERALLKGLGGGCQVPVAGHCRLDGGGMTLRGMVAELDGSRIITDEMKGGEDSPEDLGTALAERLLASGAAEILNRVYGKG